MSPILRRKISQIKKKRKANIVQETLLAFARVPEKPQFSCSCQVNFVSLNFSTAPPAVGRCYTVVMVRHYCSSSLFGENLATNMY